MGILDYFIHRFSDDLPPLYQLFRPLLCRDSDVPFCDEEKRFDGELEVSIYKKSKSETQKSGKIFFE